MAETVQALRVEVKITARVAGTDGSRLQTVLSYNKVFTDGTGADQVGSVFVDETRPLNATSEDLDLAGGLTDFQGTALALNNCKVIFAENLDTDAGDTLKLKPGGTNPVTGILSGTSPELTIYPGGLLLWVAPSEAPTVTGGSADTIAFETADNSNYKLLLAGDNA